MVYTLMQLWLYGIRTRDALILVSVPIPSTYTCTPTCSNVPIHIGGAMWNGTYILLRDGVTSYIVMTDITELQVLVHS